MPPRMVRPELPEALAGVEVRRVRLPLLEPFRAAHGTETVREVVLVRAIGEDGAEGWGECVALSAPTYTDEWTDGAWELLTGGLLADVLRRRPVEVGDHPMAWTAVEVAFADLGLRRAGRSLASHLGAARRSVEQGVVVGIRADPDATVEAVRRALGDRPALVKLKVVPGTAVEHLRAVRAAVGDVALAADANGGFRLDDPAHERELAELDGLGLVYVEQPVPSARAAVELAGRWRTTVALDESIGGPADVAGLVAAGFAGVVNLKPGRVGGLAASLEVLGRCRAAGLGVFVGGMLETGVGRATALAVAAHPACTLPTDLGPSDRYFADDLTEPLVLDAEGRLPVPAGPGLGVTPRPDRLDACTVARHRVPW